MSHTVPENKMKDKLKSCFVQLRLGGIADSYEELSRLALKESLSHEEYLLELLEHECDYRRHKRISRLLRESKLPLEKRMENFDTGRLGIKLKQQIKVLLAGDFIERSENILLFGNPGSGKTHLLCGIGRKLVEDGRRVLFCSCSLLVQELLLAKKELLLPQKLKKLSRYEVLILDDIGYVKQSRDEIDVLFELLSQRYERGSVMLSSNLPFSRWDEVFKDPMLAAAAVDRLVHHSVVIELNVESFRMQHALSSRGQSSRGVGIESSDIKGDSENRCIGEKKLRSKE
jgi:DNA replication protein DnaC